MVLIEKAESIIQKEERTIEGWKKLEDFYSQSEGEDKKYIGRLKEGFWVTASRDVIVQIGLLEENKLKGTQLDEIDLQEVNDIRADAPRGGKSKGAKKLSRVGGKKRKNCDKGITCGGSCISRTKTCRKDGNATQKSLAKKIKSGVGGGVAVPAINPNVVQNPTVTSLPDNYQIPDNPSGLKKIGEGAEGVIYKDGDVIIKYIKNGAGITFSSFEVDISRQVGEMGIAPRILGVKNEGSKPKAVAMEYLNNHISAAKFKASSEQEQITVFRNILGAFEQTNKAGIAHGDGHKHNIFISNGNFGVKLIDFGYSSRDWGEAYRESLGRFRAPRISSVPGGKSGNAKAYKVTVPIAQKYARMGLYPSPAEAQQRLNSFWAEINQALNSLG